MKLFIRLYDLYANFCGWVKYQCDAVVGCNMFHRFSILLYIVIYISLK